MEQRTNDEWLNDLRADGERRAQAVDDLRAILVQRLPQILSGRLSSENPDFDTYVTSLTEKTIAWVLEDLNSYKRHSGFITWVFKINLRQTLSELRRLRWQADLSRGDLPAMPSRMYTALANDEFMQYIHQVFRDELTDNQRFAIRSMIMVRMPKEEVAKRLNMERCDYFKMIHDARLRLKRRLEADGWLSANRKSQK
jgi:RNA polymerase sigma-70 factor (ECF subfamily)